MKEDEGIILFAAAVMAWRTVMHQAVWVDQFL
jgi:hypothetical protein